MSSRGQLVEIRGLAAPFNRPTFIAGRGIEVLDPCAFAGMLATGKRVPVLWDSHSEGTETIRLANEARLFAAPVGLMFSAMFDLTRHWSLVAAIVRRKNPVDQVSVGGMDIRAERSDMVDGMQCLRVTDARIEHVTICRDAAYRTATAVWRADVPLDQAPLRIQEMAAQWEDGRAVARLEAKRGSLLVQARAIVNAPGKGPGGDLSDRQFAAVRANIAAVEAIDRQIKAVRSSAEAQAQ